jgi:hypothetical protein
VAVRVAVVRNFFNPINVNRSDFSVERRVLVNFLIPMVFTIIYRDEQKAKAED